MRSVKNILWSYGVSGDFPIVLIVIKNYEDINIIYDVVKEHEYWEIKGVHVDLIVISKEGVRYDHPLWNSIYDIICTSHLRNMQNMRGGVFILRGEILSCEEYEVLRRSARIIFEDGRIETAEEESKNDLKKMKFEVEPKEYENVLETKELDVFNGIGGFDEKNNEYVMYPSKDINTPLPWSNILANKSFGTVVTETGGGFTWSDNSREFRITPWSNDEVEDKRGEIIYIRDDETGEIFNPYILPCSKSGNYEVRYGLGYVKYIAAVCGLKLELTVFVPKEQKVKVSIFKIKNMSNAKRKLSFIYYVDPVLNSNNELKERYINVKYEDRKLVFSNEYEQEFMNKKMFMKIWGRDVSYCLDKETFFGAGKEKSPEILKYENLGNISKYILPIGSLKTSEEFNENDEKEIIFLLGEDNNSIINYYSKIENCLRMFENTKEYFKDEIMRIKVKTPDKEINLLLNGFLLYQTLVCRLWSRSALYQSGGARGFRDQLQDSLAFTYINPGITREQILIHAAHQFEEGDVLHWWHEEGKKGTRTRFSDDLLWLPYAVAEYISVTGDENILNEEINFVTGQLLEDSEQERYLEFQQSNKKEDVFKHCILAIERAYKLGKHGLALMGSGDWNDGMNKVGAGGKGESVWLSMFLYKILTAFSPLCRLREEYEKAELYAEHAAILAKNINDNAWDGEWYKRAFFDDGTPLGTIQNEECKIDSICQSWSVISGLFDYEKSKRAMLSVENYLTDRENKIIKLLTPAFSKGNLDPGYIKNYPEGVRENGGQYTHAAIWAGIAYAILKDNENSNAIFDMLNPINHSKTDTEMKKYKVEPYVMSADIYTNSMHTGRGGWSWYTGAAAWMYRFGIEYILGFKKKRNRIILDPLMRKGWDEFELEYKCNRTSYKMKVMNKMKEGIEKLVIDGVLSTGNSFEIVDDGGIHFVELTI